MYLLKLMSIKEYLKNYISLFLIFFFISNLLNAKADDNTNLIRSRQKENNLEKFYSYSAIKYDLYDQGESQLKMFFGFDPENPGISFFPDSLIIDYSKNVRDLYKLKLNDITIKK